VLGQCISGYDTSVTGMAAAQKKHIQVERVCELAASTAGMEGYANQGVNIKLLRLMRDLLNRAIKAGYGGEEAAAVIKVMRDGDEGAT